VLGFSPLASAGMVRDSAAVGKQSTTVSMVVTDIVGSTAMSERLGPDKTDEARRAHFETLRGAVAQTGGTEVKNLGDGLMVAYGSARDALEGAIAMQRAADAAARRGSEVAIRVGVATGDAFVEDGDYFGIPVVEAARLCSAARGGQILTTALVRMLTDRTAHGLHSVGQLELKGLAEPVEAFEVAWEVSAAGHEIPVPARVARPPRYGFVGRDAERARLSAMWEAATTGERGVALLYGEPGIGKTTLVGEMARTAASNGAIVLSGTGPYTDTVGIDQAGTFSCGANVTCSGTPVTAQYEATGTLDQTLTITVPATLALVNQTQAAPDLTLNVDAPATVVLDGTGYALFDIGGDISVSDTTLDGVYQGTFDVEADYQ